MRYVMGDHALTTPVETLLRKRNEGGIPNDVARLRGARLVTASESEAGRSLAESLIKDMTGGEPLTARFLHGEWFEFAPTLKLWLGTNHKPVIRGTDLAIWRRVRLIPFEVTIPESECDPLLLTRLIAEAPGILAWMVRGCLDWQHSGLGLPPAVEAATMAYREDSDTLGSFFDDCCVLTANADVKAGDLYTTYRGWAEANGEQPLNNKRFGQALTERGFTRYKASGYPRYGGIRLAQRPAQHDDSRPS